MVAAASNIVSNGIVLEVLTRDNYLNWSTLVKNYLVGKDLWDNIVEDINSDEIVPDWKSKNSKALHAIQLSCGYQTLSQIRNSETAKEAWNHLKASFSEDVEAYHDIEQGRSESDNLLDQFHSSVKKGLWNEAESILNRDRDIISRRSSSTGWTALHVAVAAGQEKIMDELFKRKGGKLLKKTDWRGYTALALAAEVNDNKKIAEWMIDNGGSDLLTMKTKADNGGKGEIPVVLASAKGNKEMTRYLFSETPWFSLQDDNCYYGAMLLSRCIYAEILDVAAALLQREDLKSLPLGNESDHRSRPIYALAHIPSAFRSGIQLNCFQQFVYTCLRPPTCMNLKSKTIEIKSCHGGSSTDASTGRSSGRFQRFVKASILKIPGAKEIYEVKIKHLLALEILKCLCERIETISSELELHQWSAHDAMLQAAKYGIIEFIEKMRAANPDLLWATDKNKRGIFAHAILNRQEKVFNLIREIKGQKGMITSIDVFGNNILHLAAELGPSSDRCRRSNAALQMQRELQWFKAIEGIVPRMCKEAKNADGIKPYELFSKNHEHLMKDGRQWIKDTSSSFTIAGTLIITIMFAVAFTVPGGNNQNDGIPIFLGKGAFSAFIIADAISLITSLSSVLMFIGILTSRYAEKDFIKSLPIKLLFGLITLFLSVTSMMVAYCVALYMMLKGKTWIAVTTIIFAFIPILVFMFSLLRISFEIWCSTLRSDILTAKKKKELGLI